MIDTQLISLLAVFVESLGIVFAEKRTAILLGLATILTIVILFMT